MNEPHAPNVTSDIPSVPANSLSAGDSPSTIDHDPATGSTDGSTGEAASASDLPSVPGYQVVSEIARGGMGRVLAAFDLTLDRDVALKVLLPGARPDRFIRESKIAARLPHPGIPPIHALGSLADGSPFLAMKLIVGQTLSDEMKTADRPMLLQAFAQVCQAVGFAHSRGIIHRDLKPANVMVGAFGEVQVMDWGLAKDLTSRDFASEPRSSETPTSGTDPNQTTDIRDPSESTDGRTQAGQVMGTPAYMPPEQARGEVTDARTDVFALGGILCRILTGKPPFSGKSSLEVIQRAAAGDLVEANVRLDGCGADAELVALCRDCLSPNPTDRPANGQAVTDRMTAYLNGVQERLQAVERERAVASARAIEERRRRKVQLIAASLVLFVLLAGIAGTTVGLLNAREQRNLADSRNEQLIVANANTENEKTRAEQNFSRARDLIMTLGTQINQIETGQKNPKIADLTRKQALDEARGQFEQFRAGLPDDVTVQLQAAALHRYSGNLSRLMYDYKAAKDAYASSIKILEDLTTRFPQSYEYRYTFAQTLGERALVEMSTGKLNDSAATWDRALKIAENPQPAAFEANYGRVVGLNEYNRAKIAHLMGRFQDAIRSAGRSKELLDQLKTVPFKEQQSIDPLLAVMPVNHLAIARRELGQYAEAMTAHDEAVARMKELNGPKANRDILFWVCEVRQERAKTAVAISEQRTAAAADLVEISRIAEKLVDENPHIAHYREKLAAVYLTRGELLALLGQFEPAAAELTKSLAASRELIDRFGSLSASMLVRGQTFLVLGRVRNAVGKKDEAAANWKNASKVFELSIKPDPDNFHLRRGLTEAERALKPPAK